MYLMVFLSAIVQYLAISEIEAIWTFTANEDSDVGCIVL